MYQGKNRIILKCFEESSRDYFNFVFSDERSTFTFTSISANNQIKYVCFFCCCSFCYYLRPLLRRRRDHKGWSRRLKLQLWSQFEKLIQIFFEFWAWRRWFTTAEIFNFYLNLALGCTCLKLTLRVYEYNKKPQE